MRDNGQCEPGTPTPHRSWLSMALPPAVATSWRACTFVLVLGPCLGGSSLLSLRCCQLSLEQLTNGDLLSAAIDPLPCTRQRDAYRRLETQAARPALRPPLALPALAPQHRGEHPGCERIACPVRIELASDR